MGTIIDALNWLLRTPSDYLVSSKISLLFLLLKYWVRNSLIDYKFLSPAPTERLLGYKINTGDYYCFFRVFIDVFIKSQYYFKTKVYKPNILDLGSHIGISILYFKMLYPSSKIVAVEADKKTFKILKKNIEINNVKGVKLFNFAVSNKKSSATFYVDPKSTAKWSSTLNRYGGFPKSKKVKTNMASNLIDEEVDFMKMDIEGSESIVIRELVTSGKLNKIKKLTIEYHKYLFDNSNHLDNLLKLLRLNGFVFTFNYFLKRRFVIMPAIDLTEKYGQSHNVLIYGIRKYL